VTIAPTDLKKKVRFAMLQTQGLYAASARVIKNPQRRCGRQTGTPSDMRGCSHLAGRRTWGPLRRLQQAEPLASAPQVLQPHSHVGYLCPREVFYSSGLSGYSPACLGKQNSVRYLHEAMATKANIRKDHSERKEHRDARDAPPSACSHHCFNQSLTSAASCDR